MSDHVPTPEELVASYSEPWHEPSGWDVEKAAREAWLGIERIRAEAWERGWETAVEQAPGDVFFDEWHYQTNPYRPTGETQ